MEIPHSLMVDVQVPEPIEHKGTASDVDNLKNQVDEMFVQVDQLEQKLKKVNQFYSTANRKQQSAGTLRSTAVVKDKDKEKQVANFRKWQQDAACREVAAAKRMQEIMRQFGTILRQITQHKWAGPFMQPVDVEGLGLYDYFDEKRRKEEEAEVQLDIQLAQEAAHTKMARELSIELDEVDMHLEELRELVLHNCRKMSTEEKRRLGAAITQLSHEDLNKALLIVAQDNPNFQAGAEEVFLDMDAQSESTLWKLKLFVKDTL